MATKAGGNVMQAPSVIGLFCEDIREEKSGSDILVGIFPDNVHVATPLNGIPSTATSLLPRMAIYVRVHLDVDWPQPKIVTTKIIAADGQEITLPSWTNEVIAKGYVDAKAAGTPLVGLLLKTSFANIPITTSGIMTIKVSIDGTDYIAANARIILTSPTALPPPV